MYRWIGDDIAKIHSTRFEVYNSVVTYKDLNSPANFFTDFRLLGSCLSIGGFGSCGYITGKPYILLAC